MNGEAFFQGVEHTGSYAIVQGKSANAEPRHTRLSKALGQVSVRKDGVGLIRRVSAFVDDDRVVSLCHSARLTDRGAEAGTWTDPDYRGRGYAAAATAAWGSLLASSGRTLFYSTSSDNLSSQRVAERLELPLIGWMWKIAPAAS